MGGAPLFPPPLPTLLREAQTVLEHRNLSAAVPVVLWQSGAETDERFDARVAAVRARWPASAPIIAASGPRTGAHPPGVKRVEFPPRLLALLDPRVKARNRVAYGGRGGAKSWAFARALILRALTRSIRILCCREYQGSIVESVHKLLSTQIGEMGLEPWFDVQRDSISSATGSEIIFTGLHHNVSKVKSTEDISICWSEEGERISAESLQVLIPTIRKPGSEVWISFNPDAKTDPVYKRFVEAPPPDTLLAFVNWPDNPWFPAELDVERQYLERVDPDAAAWIWGGQCKAASDAQIFRGKYSVEAFEPGPGFSGPYFGCDFGFAQDPTTLVRCWIHDRKLYVDFEAYAIGCDLDRTPALLDQVPDSRRHVIRADCARPESISYLQRHGFSRMTGVEKWAGSVEDGIAHLRQYEQIVIHPRCTHAIEEMRRYSYKTDRLSGDIKAEPLDRHNHIVDALRYALAPLIRRSGFGFIAFIEQEEAEKARLAAAAVAPFVGVPPPTRPAQGV